MIEVEEVIWWIAISIVIGCVGVLIIGPVFYDYKIFP
jgi:hypothetical protein